MKKIILFIALFISSVAFSQWPPERTNPEFYPALRVADSLQLDFLQTSSDTLVLVTLPNSNAMTSFTFAELRSAVGGGSGGGGVTAAQLSDTANVLRGEFAADLANYLRLSDTAAMLLPYAKVSQLPDVSGFLNTSDTAAMLSTYAKTSELPNLAPYLLASDTTAMLSVYAKTSDLPSLTPYVEFTDTLTTIATKTDVANITSTGITRTELGDTATAIRALANTKLESVVAGSNVTIDNTDPHNPIINSSGGGGSSITTRIITGGRDTISNTSEEVLFISTSQTEDTLYLAPNLILDSLSNVYFEKHRGGDLIIFGGVTNNLNESAAKVLTVPVRGGGFIRCLGSIGGVIRFSAIGNYTE